MENKTIEYVWEDKNHNMYQMNEITDRHLANILPFLCRGGGWLDFLSGKKIEALFKEAEKRGIEIVGTLEDALTMYESKERYTNDYSMLYDGMLDDVWGLDK